MAYIKNQWEIHRRANARTIAIMTVVVPGRGRTLGL